MSEVWDVVPFPLPFVSLKNLSQNAYVDLTVITQMRFIFYLITVRLISVYYLLPCRCYHALMKKQEKKSVINTYLIINTSQS